MVEAARTVFDDSSATLNRTRIAASLVLVSGSVVEAMTVSRIPWLRAMKNEFIDTSLWMSRPFTAQNRTEL